MVLVVCSFVFFFEDICLFVRFFVVRGSRFEDVLLFLLSRMFIFLYIRLSFEV